MAPQALVWEQRLATTPSPEGSPESSGPQEPPLREGRVLGEQRGMNEAEEERTRGTQVLREPLQGSERTSGGGTGRARRPAAGGAGHAGKSTDPLRTHGAGRTPPRGGLSTGLPEAWLAPSMDQERVREGEKADLVMKAQKNHRGQHFWERPDGRSPRKDQGPRGFSVEPGAVLGGKGRAHGPVGLAGARRSDRSPVLQEGSRGSAFPDPPDSSSSKGNPLAPRRLL